MAHTTDTVFIDDLRFDAIIGVQPHERRIPQPLVIHLRLETDSVPVAAASDALEDTVDYARVATDVQAYCETRRALLVETLAEGIAERVLGDPKVHGVHVRVAKPEALANAGAVGVEIYRCTEAD